MTNPLATYFNFLYVHVVPFKLTSVQSRIGKPDSPRFGIFKKTDFTRLAIYLFRIHRREGRTARCVATVRVEGSSDF